VPLVLVIVILLSLRDQSGFVPLPLKKRPSGGAFLLTLDLKSCSKNLPVVSAEAGSECATLGKSSHRLKSYHPSRNTSLPYLQSSLSTYRHKKPFPSPLPLFPQVIDLCTQQLCSCQWIPN
jgi:hypothetical protein